MALSVKFYQRPEFMAFLSDKEQRPIHEMRDYVRIEIPGMVANVVDTLAGPHHKQEFAVQWAQYVAEKATGDFSEHQGTLLSSWPQLNAAQVLELRHYKFYTVEQISEASDQQIQSIGMLAGMSPLSLRDKAKAWLGNAQMKEAESGAAAERDALKAELAELRAMILKSKPDDDEPETVDAPRRGRPPKPSLTAQA